MGDDGVGEHWGGALAEFMGYVSITFKPQVGIKEPYPKTLIMKEFKLRVERDTLLKKLKSLLELLFELELLEQIDFVEGLVDEDWELLLQFFENKPQILKLIEQIRLKIKQREKDLLELSKRRHET